VVNQTTNIYRHANVRNGITVVNKNSFITGKGNYKKFDTDNFSRENIVAGRPEPKPNSKEILMPQIRKIPSSRLPPPNVAKLPVRELKDRFPKMDKGTNFVPHHPEATEPVRHEKPGKAPTYGVSTPFETKSPGGKVPVAKPAVQQPRLQDNQEYGSNPAERKPLEYERRRPQAIESPAGNRGTGAERREPAVEKRSQGVKAPDRQQPPRNAAPKATTPQERTPRNVWKIQTNEDGQPGREKK
jgi:hypothetical protein